MGRELDRFAPTVVKTPSQAHIRHTFVTQFRNGPDDGSPAELSTMGTASSVSATLAVIPNKEDAPRVIQQFTSIFLVGRYGCLWRVYDTAAPNSADRRMPSAGTSLSTRIFVALARKAEERAYSFVPGESHDIDPVSLQRQLDESASQ